MIYECLPCLPKSQKYRTVSRIYRLVYLVSEPVLLLSSPEAFPPHNELNYSVEIQELRHQDLGSSEISGASSSTSLSGAIDQALIKLDERLENVAQSIAAINATIEPFLQPHTPTSGAMNVTEVDEGLLRKHSSVLSEWEGVQSEAEVLRDELKEDKWLAVFRNASDQADGMMNSLEKVITQCHVCSLNSSSGW